MLSLLGCFAVALTSLAQTPPPARDSVAITAYNEGTALVQDRRTLTLTAGENVIDFTDVAGTIDPTSVSFKSLSDPEGTYVIEQNYVYDLVDKFALLERYLDETIQVTAQDGTVFVGQLLSGRTGDIILKTASGEVQVIGIDKVRDLSFPSLPNGLITRPTLRWLVFSATGGEQQIELTYLAYGMSWTADYTVLLGTDNTSLDLNGWVTLNNTSGTTYPQATLKLVAGDVNRIKVEQPMMRDMMFEAVSAAPDGAGVEQRDFFEYKLYQVQRPVTIADNETKQIEFVTSANVPARTFYVYSGAPAYYNYGYALTDAYYGQSGVTTVSNYLEFSTGAEDGANADLPAGRVRVYQADVDGAALLIGENRISHTPKGETVQIYLGNAFDLVGERTQVSYRAISSNVYQETFEIKLRNRKASGEVEVRVPEVLFRWNNWQILETSMPFTQLDANTIEYRVTVPAGQEVTVRYTVQYSFP
jgi:hypothetical protein